MSPVVSREILLARIKGYHYVIKNTSVNLGSHLIKKISFAILGATLCVSKSW